MVKIEKRPLPVVSARGESGGRCSRLAKVFWDNLAYKR